MQAPSPRIAAIVVTYHPDLGKLTEQLCALTHQVSDVVIVDNGSSPDILAALDCLARQRGWADQFHLLPLGSNTGIAHAQNQGIQCARARGSTHVLLMDQDSVPTTGMVPRLMEAFNGCDSSKIAAVGPRIHDPRSGSSLDCLKKTASGYRRLHIPPSALSPVEVDHLIASGTLIALSTLDRLGGMDSSLFIDAVDTEWCLRARAAGYRLLAHPQAVLTHNLGSHSQRIRFGGMDRTVAFHPPSRQYYIFRNNILVCRRAYIDNAWRRRVAMTLFRRALLYIMIGPNRLGYLREICRGILDALRGRHGSRPTVSTLSSGPA
jgi:rhamnosyltransferase